MGKKIKGAGAISSSESVGLERIDELRNDAQKERQAAAKHRKQAYFWGGIAVAAVFLTAWDVIHDPGEKGLGFYILLTGGTTGMAAARGRQTSVHHQHAQRLEELREKLLLATPKAPPTVLDLPADESNPGKFAIGHSGLDSFEKTMIVTSQVLDDALRSQGVDLEALRNIAPAKRPETPPAS